VSLSVFLCFLLRALWCFGLELCNRSVRVANFRGVGFCLHALEGDLLRTPRGREEGSSGRRKKSTVVCVHMCAWACYNVCVFVSHLVHYQDRRGRLDG